MDQAKVPRAGVILMPADKQHVLLVYGAYSHKWSPPKGGLEPNETIAEGAKRECKEETGLEVDFPENTQYANIRKQHYYCLTTADNSVMDIPLLPWDVREIEKVAWLTWDEINNLPAEHCNAITMELRRPATYAKIMEMSTGATASAAGPKPVNAYIGSSGQDRVAHRPKSQLPAWEEF